MFGELDREGWGRGGGGGQTEGGRERKREEEVNRQVDRQTWRGLEDLGMRVVTHTSWGSC